MAALTRHTQKTNEIGLYDGSPSTDQNSTGNSKIRTSTEVVNFTSANGVGSAECNRV